MSPASGRVERAVPGADEVLVASFYRFAPLDDCADLRAPLLQSCRDLGLLGTILLAPEGINGSVAGTQSAVRRLLARLRADRRLADLDCRFSRAAEQPFHRMKVRLKNEIVTLGVPGVDPLHDAGEYVPPERWNELIAREDVRVIDTRNDYEVRLGTFEGAENPGTRSFRDFPAWAERKLDPQRDRRVAMFCTGGIRCEKSTALLRRMGVEHVYHLQGGILNYLETVDPKDSLWRGDCFVFDNRVTVDHELQAGDIEVCPACRMPVTEEDRRSPLFERNVSCPRCHHRLTEEKRVSLLERARQMELAARRGERHLGQRMDDD